ncbi:hypothetical protein C8J57DRAFT_1473160 [Mycena rebaudengoi]|nr:hypothetical protein C8J57DRAFT_1473160 [Mycena rebaudengoi]
MRQKIRGIPSITHLDKGPTKILFKIRRSRSDARLNRKHMMKSENPKGRDVLRSEQSRTAKRLEDLSKERRTALMVRNNPEKQHLADVDTHTLYVGETGTQQKNWRLCLGQGEDGVLDEVVVRLQGVLTKNNLVPKNAVAVSMSSTAETTSTFGKSFSASNRLFTSKTEAPTEQDNDFQYGVDPIGTLHRLKGADLIHAPDNISSSAISYEETIPGMFKVGDIVEMQISFVAILSAQKTVKINNRLQALTLLDRKFTKKAGEDRAFSESNRQTTSKAVRRKTRNAANYQLQHFSTKVNGNEHTGSLQIVTQAYEPPSAEVVEIGDFQIPAALVSSHSNKEQVGVEMITILPQSIPSGSVHSYNQLVVLYRIGREGTRSSA